MGRLAKPTSVIDANKTASLATLYPDHAKALRKSELVTKELPTLEEMLKEVEAKAGKIKSPERARQLRLQKNLLFYQSLQCMEK